MDRKDKLFLMMTGVALGATAFGFIYNVITVTENTPSRVYFMEDLNRDEKKDLILENKRGHKTPLYAVIKEDGSINYVSADEYKKMHPNDIINYETIEDKLNKK